MVPDGNRPLNPSLSFEIWKMHLRQDCVEKGKLPAFDALGDSVLRMLWEQGVDPSVRAIAGHGPEHPTAAGGELA